MSGESAGAPEVATDPGGPAGRSAAVLSMAAAWALSIGIDLFLHAGLLARLYVEPSPFLLPAQDAFRRIPLGYLTFLILTVGLFWLLRRLRIRGFTAGFRLAAVAGAVVWGAPVLGLYSISTANPGLLIGWWIGQTVELSVAGDLPVALPVVIEPHR